MFFVTQRANNRAHFWAKWRLLFIHCIQCTRKVILMPYFKADVYIENVFFIKLNFCDFSKFYMKKCHFTTIVIPSWVGRL